MPVLSNPTIGADSFRVNIANAIREQAELADSSGDTQAVQSRARTLRLLADYIESLDPADQHLAALAEAERESGNTSDSDNRWEPRGKVSHVLAYAGGNPKEPPKSADLLDELVRYSASDSRIAVREQVVANTTAQMQTERLAAAAKIEAEVSRAQAQEDAMRSRAHDAEAAVVEVRKELAHTKALLDGKRAATGAKVTA